MRELCYQNDWYETRFLEKFKGKFRPVDLLKTNFTEHFKRNLNCLIKYKDLPTLKFLNSKKIVPVGK